MDNCFVQLGCKMHGKYFKMLAGEQRRYSSGLCFGHASFCILAFINNQILEGEAETRLQRGECCEPLQ